MRGEVTGEIDLRLQALMFGLAGGDDAGVSLPAARRAVRRRFHRLYRRRRLRHTISSSTVAAGLFAGAHQLPNPSRSEQPFVERPVDAESGPAHSWTWDEAAGVDREAADPGALIDGDRLHVFTTSSADGRVPRFTSTGTGTGAGPTAGPGQLAGDAMPSRPDWVDPDDDAIWAPQVARVGDRYVMWFAATSGRSEDGGMKCLGAAVATAPDHAFVPLPEPLLCTPGYWNIDPYPVVDGDRVYLLWRQDGPAHVTGTVVAAELRPDGLAPARADLPPTTLLVGAYPWEEGYPGSGSPGVGPIENPALARHPETGEWLLTWSANLWETQRYATGLAVCAGPLGPCDRVSREEPWVGTSDDAGVVTSSRFGGAGGLSFATDGEGDQLYAVLHAYSGAGEAPAAPRVSWVFRVAVDSRAGTGSRPTYRLVDVVGNRSAQVSVNGS